MFRESLLTRPLHGTLIDWSHPSTDRLRHAFLLNDGGGIPLNSTGYWAEFPSIGAGRTWTGAGWDGNVQDHDGSTTAYLDLGAQADLTGDFAVVARVRTDTTTGLHTVFGSNKSDGSERIAGSLYVENDATTGSVPKFVYWRSDVATAVVGATTVAIGQWYTVGVVLSGTTATIYLDGKIDGSGTVAGAITATAGNFRVGFAGAYTGAAWDGQIALFCLWTRPQPPDEALSLSVDPYQVWVRDEQPVVAGATAPAAAPVWWGVESTLPDFRSVLIPYHF